MKKIIISTILLLICCFSNVKADEIQEKLSSFKDSAFVVLANNLLEESKGTATLVANNGEYLLFLSAKHLLLGQNTKIKVLINNEKIVAEKYLEIQNTDCIYFLVKYKNTILKPIPLNLDNSTNKVGALAIGFGGWSKKLTGAMGEVERTTIDRFTFPGGKYHLLEGLIKGTIPLIGGFSGGPIVDTDGRLLGISIINASNGSLFVDIRYIYNHITLLNLGKKVKCPVDNFINISQNDNDTRLRYKTEPKIIQEIINNHTNIGNVINRATKIIVDGKEYKISYFIIEHANNNNEHINREEIIFPFPFTQNRDYIYIPSNGWFATLYLAP